MTAARAPEPMPPTGADLARAAVIGALTLVGAVALLWLAFLLRQLIAVVLLGIVVGTTLGPQVDALARYRVPRILSGLVVYLVVAGIIVGFLAYAIPQLASELSELGDRIDEFRADYEEIGDGAPLPEWEEIQPWIEERLDAVATALAAQAGTVATSIVYTFTVFVVGLFWTVSRGPASALFLSLVDVRYHERTHQILDLLGRRLRHYLLAELAGMVAIGAITYIGLSLIGVPYAFVLAAIAFALEILPILGPWLAFVPALAIALTEGWQTALLVSVLYLGVQQIESYVIVPVFHRHGTGMPELLILIAVLVGGALMGVLGALVALPLAVIVHTLLMEALVPARQAQVEEQADEQLEAEAL
ncbi:MAG: AI-2E family transporter [Dehalococcoidia bacterium]